MTTESPTDAAGLWHRSCTWHPALCGGQGRHAGQGRQAGVRDTADEVRARRACGQQSVLPFLSAREQAVSNSRRWVRRDSYLMGVQALLRSLRGVGAAHPLAVMFTADTLSEAAVQALTLEGAEMLAVERYLPDGAAHDPAQYKLSLYAECWSKLRMWEQAQYQRLVYLDADTVVLRNLDHLFDLPGDGLYAVGDCAFGRATEAERRACPFFRHGRPHYFNAGFFCMTPSQSEFKRFGRLLSSRAVEIGGFAEQDFLNAVYGASFTPLPWHYNAQKGILRHHPGLFSLRHAAVIHVSISPYLAVTLPLSSPPS